MSVEYSLITWAGLGTTVTFTDVGDIVNLTNHGARNGQGFRFLDNSNTLPTGLSKDTLYYIREGADANKFTIYPTYDDAITGTNQVTFTGTGSGTHKVVGEYYYSLPATDPGGGGNYRGRYGGDSGYVNGRVFAGFTYWRTYANANPDIAKDVIVEIEGAWDDKSTTGSISYYYYSIIFTTKINGILGSGFHNGARGGGYRRYYTSNTSIWSLGGPRVRIEYTETYSTYTTGGSGVLITAPGCSTHGNIITAYIGIDDASTSGKHTRNIAIDCANIGFKIPSSNSSDTIYANNLATGCGTGFAPYTAGGNTSATVFNNVSIGNTTNWGSVGSLFGYCTKNSGKSGDTPWTSSTGEEGPDVTSSDFVDYSNDNYILAGTSVLIDAGESSQYIDAVDILGTVVPNYESTTYPANYWDIGPFEYNHGDGIAPEVLTITNLTTGSRVIATRHDTGASLGTSMESSGTATISLAYSGTVDVEARNASGTPTYKPWSTQINFPTTKNVIALQEED